MGSRPRHGGRLNLADLDLVQKRNHILQAAMDALPDKDRQLLSTLALLSEAVTTTRSPPSIRTCPPSAGRSDPGTHGTDADPDSAGVEKQAWREQRAEYERAAGPG